MIDPATDEILSRFLDGDLGAEESRGLAERLDCDPALQEALDEMRDLRGRLRRMALEERPPEALDHMVRPLRRAGRPRQQRWAAVALVAAAAVIIVGLIVVTEVGRTGWMPWNGSSGEEDRGVFALSNLPTRNPEAPLGAIETLMASENAEPTIVDPEPLEVMGPLDEPAVDREWVLLVENAEVVLPLPGIVGFAGLRVEIQVEAGHVTRCQGAGGVEDTAETADVCRLIVSANRVGLADGQHEGNVVKWDDINRIRLAPQAESVLDPQ